LVVFGFSFGFIIIGINFILIPVNLEAPRWFLGIVGAMFVIFGCVFIFTLIKFLIENYIENG